MFRIKFVCIVAISLVVAALGTPTPSQSGKNHSILGFEGAEEELISALEQSYQTKRMGEFGSVLEAIKNPFREIIEDIMVQAFEYFKIHLQQFKVNLLRKIGKYTLSDVFHTIFDGVYDFVAIESAPAPADEELSNDKAVAVTADFNGFNDAYSLAALLASKKREVS